VRHARLIAILLAAAATTAATTAAMSAMPRTAAAQSGVSALPAARVRAVFQDARGVIRWKDDSSEVALFGANYIIPSASDYRAAGYLKLDRKRMIDDDMAHFARLGWDGMRLTLWGDWENADTLGNLIANDHLDLFDYLIARARERGVYMLLSPIQTYNSNWPDSLASKLPGFSAHYKREELGTNPAAIAAQVRYIGQLLEHVNPYTHTKIKDEPAILFIEMINEPVHHPDDLAGSVKYIDALADAVRKTGCTKLLFHNVSQDFRIAGAIKRSTVQGVSFGWYPTGLNSGHELEGNYLRTVDSYDRMNAPALDGLARIVYEFDSADLRTGYMYPAMARAFRGAGAQFAAMFAYDMLGTASRNLGWQTHYLNLVYTPRKAISAVIAAEVMRRVPRGATFGAYPANRKFGDFRVSYEENLSELVADDAFLNAGATTSTPPHPEKLKRIAGVGSSPVVNYAGDGVYFLDKLRDGWWRLEVYADAEPVRDPYEMPGADKLVTRAINRAWPMRVTLPDLGRDFQVTRIAGDSAVARRAGAKRIATADSAGRFTVTPGVYLLQARALTADPTARLRVPMSVGHLALGEYHGAPPDTFPPHVEPLAAASYATNHPVEIRARVVTTDAPDSVMLSIRAPDWGNFWRLPMHRTAAYEYTAVVPDSLREGAYEYVVSVQTAGAVTSFPGERHRAPGDWDWSGNTTWHFVVARPGTPFRLFAAQADAERMAFTRIGDGGRRGIFRVVPSQSSGEPALHLEVPVVQGETIDDYTASLVVRDRIAARREYITRDGALVIRARAVPGAAANAGADGERLHVTLVESDGTAWGVAVTLDGAWRDVTIPLSALMPERSAALPVGFPGVPVYWLEPPANRGGPGDAMRPEAIERIQFSLRRGDGAPTGAATGATSATAHGVEIESVTLRPMR